MKTVARILDAIEWAITLGVSCSLLQFGAERMSQWVATRYVYGSAGAVDTWLTILGLGALVATFLLIHPITRWYTAAALTAFFVIASLSSMSFGEPQPLLVPVLGLGSALVVLFSHRPGHDEIERDLPSCTGVEHHG